MWPALQWGGSVGEGLCVLRSRRAQQAFLRRSEVQIARRREETLFSSCEEPLVTVWFRVGSCAATIGMQRAWPSSRITPGPLSFCFSMG